MRKINWQADKPNSVLWTHPDRITGYIQSDDHSSSPAITDGVKRPTRHTLPPQRKSERAILFGLSRGCGLFGLAPCGVCPASSVTGGAVRSYRTFSPLLRKSGAVYFLWHFPSPPVPPIPFGIPIKKPVNPEAPTRYVAHCPVEFGLSSPVPFCGIATIVSTCQTKL